MSITVHEFDGITRQFRIKPNEMSLMSTPTMSPNYLSIKKFEQALRENALAISSYQTHLGQLALDGWRKEKEKNVELIHCRMMR